MLVSQKSLLFLITWKKSKYWDQCHQSHDCNLYFVLSPVLTNHKPSSQRQCVSFQTFHASTSSFNFIMHGIRESNITTKFLSQWQNIIHVCSQFLHPSPKQKQ